MIKNENEIEEENEIEPAIPSDIKNQFFNAIIQNEFEMVKSLVTSYPSLLKEEEKGSSPFHYAAKHGHLDLIKYFHEEGANITIKNHVGSTILHTASLFRKINVVKYLLIEKSIDINIRDRLCHTALTYAIIALQTEIARLLIEKKAHINTTNIGEKIDLDISAKKAFENHQGQEVFKFLLPFRTIENLNILSWKKIMFFEAKANSNTKDIHEVITAYLDYRNI